MSLRYYQIGGFGNNMKLPKAANSYMSKKSATEYMANTLCITKGETEFILGITPSGASYLLIPVPTASQQYPNLFIGQGCSSSRFISLSPISFPDENALVLKLRKLEHKKGPTDSSQANKHYILGRSVSEITDVGVARANFEIQRLFLKLCRQELSQPVHHYDIQPVPWLQDLQFVSVAHNFWRFDRRPVAERKESPIVLDFGWSTYASPSPTEGFSPLSTTHIRVSENSMWRNPNASEFLHGTTEPVTKEEIRSRFQDLLRASGSVKTVRGTVVLVHDAQWTEIALRSFGIDTSEWKSGLETLLGLRSLPKPAVNADQYRSRPERAQSPRRRSTEPSRHRSPIRKESNASSQLPVYLVDVKRLYNALSRTWDPEQTLIVNASRLHVAANNPAWNAGNESRVLGEMWYTMVGGSAIDEQYDDRFSGVGGLSSSGEPVAPKVPASAEPVAAPASGNDDDDDEDEDPNDIRPRASASINQQTSGVVGSGSKAIVDDPYASDSDDY